MTKLSKSPSVFILVMIAFAAGLNGCASAGVAAGQSGKGAAAVEIRFKGKPGTSSEARYSSTSRILTYSENQLVKDRTETVDFTVRNDIKSFDPSAETITFTSTTTKKDGVVPLHDLAFPEKDETVEYLIKSTGEVLRAGEFPPQSIFYVPSMPIPKNKVRVGDTWPMEFVWASAREGIPLKLEVVGILKEITSCNGGHRCADVEISGHVSLVIKPDAVHSRFDSRIWGRMLFDIDRGDVTWSQTRSREEMTNKTEKVLVQSCMVSETQGETGYRTKLECEPTEEPVSTVPSL